MRRATRLALPLLFLAAVTSFASTTGPSATDQYGTHPLGKVLHPVRRQIIAAALGEVGVVSDLGGKHGMKKGWEHLKRYFDEASDWGPDCFAMGKWVKDGIQKAGRNPPGAEWCGIFASWCCVQGGVTARWKFGVGPVPLQAHYDVQNIEPGDIGVIARFVHHFIITRRDGNTLECVNGNSAHHGITKGTRDISTIRYYYKPIADVWVDDGSGGGGGVTPSAHPTLRQGSSGSEVVLLQQDLIAKGYGPLSATGFFGTKTAAAVRQFQSDSGLVVDGIVGPATWQALETP